MTSLYVVGVAADAPEDMSPRARRILQEVALVLTDEGEAAGRLLEQQAISTPLLALTDAQSTADLLPAGDAALLFCHGAPGPSERGRALVRAALQAGMAVVPIPGPALAITALVVSGLPAQSFVYLDQLPPDPAARQQLVASFAAEHRTLVLLSQPQGLARVLDDLHAAWGDRPLVLAAQEEGTGGVVWRGRLAEAVLEPPAFASYQPLALVIGGAETPATRWPEEQLRAEIQRRLPQQQGAKELSRQLAAESGWPRRAVYRLVVELSQAQEDENL